MIPIQPRFSTCKATRSLISALALLLGAWSVGLSPVAPAAAAAPVDSKKLAARDQFFERQVRPILERRCFECHGPDLREGGLRLDVGRLALAGGDSGLAIVAGNIDEGELPRRVRASDAKERMPPDGPPLTVAEIKTIERWIKEGAAWSDRLDGPDADRDHWAFQPLRTAPVPQAAGGEWARDPIDAWALARWSRDSIEPSESADPATLVRRLALDLEGLPPSAELVDEFLAEKTPDAYERLVDRLLASPRFGERWGKHWLDLARFAESDGYENDNPRPHAWRYREWVIRAYNRDLPFDQFTIEQLAGDLLADATSDQRQATAFLRTTLYNSAGGADREEFRVKAVKERTAATGMIWLGLTLQCAECHSHKYDPISQREYYQWFAFFNDADESTEGDVPVVKAGRRETRRHHRGNFLEPRELVVPDVPSIFTPLESRRSTTANAATPADRLDLARWLVAPEQALAARVAASHVWQHLFGEGLAPNPENFGRQSSPPEHAELLDWLAREYQATGSDLAWSRKSLVRRICGSMLYRQASTPRDPAPESDPDNRLFWRQNRFRLEAEIVRDSTLAAAGILDHTLGGASVQPPLPVALAQLGELKNERFVEPHGNPRRRGLYVHMQRTFPFPLLATFDAPDGNQCLARRDRSITPLQSLALLNDPSIDLAARALGDRVRAATADPLERARLAWRWGIGRDPNEAEREILAELLDQMTQRGAPDEAIWHGVARTLFSYDRFLVRE